MVDNVIWPAYLDGERSRGQGRRVPEAMAVPDPTADEIASAARQIGYDAVVERDRTYPKDFTPRGRVIVKDADDATKNDLVQAIAAYVRALRDQRK